MYLGYTMSRTKGKRGNVNKAVSTSPRETILHHLLCRGVN